MFGIPAFQSAQISKRHFAMLERERFGYVLLKPLEANTAALGCFVAVKWFILKTYFFSVHYSSLHSGCSACFRHCVMFRNACRLVLFWDVCFSSGFVLKCVTFCTHTCNLERLAHPLWHPQVSFQLLEAPWGNVGVEGRRPDDPESEFSRFENKFGISF